VRIRVPAIMLIGLIAAPLTLAQSASDLLDTKRWRERTYGISLLPPVGAKLIQQTGADHLLQIIDGKIGYAMSVSIERSKRPLSLKTVHESALMQLAQAHPAAKIISDEQMTYAKQPGRRIVFAAPLAGKKTLLIAQSIVQVTPTTYLVVDGRGEWKKHKQIMAVFDAMLGSLEIADQLALAKKRAEAIKRTSAWREKLGDDYLKKLPKIDAYFRLAQNKDDIGWMRVVTDSGEFNQAKGLSVSVTTHLKLPAARVDSAAEYFVPFASAVGEAWLIRTTIRSNKPGVPARTTVETGSGGMGTIEVRIDGAGGAQSKPLKFARPTDGYLPQGEAWLLQHLLPRDAAGEYGFYWYNTADGKIVFRSDKVTPMLTGFVITSNPSLNTEELRATYDQDGKLLRKDLGGNRTLVRSTLKELQSIWKMR
jgi:hypothetical protein